MEGADAEKLDLMEAPGRLLVLRDMLPCLRHDRHGASQKPHRCRDIRL